MWFVGPFTRPHPAIWRMVFGEYSNQLIIRFFKVNFF